VRRAQICGTLFAALLFWPSAAGGAPVRPLPLCVDPPTLVSGPYSLSIDAGVGIGFFFRTHGRLALSIARRFWQRLELEITARVDVGNDMVGVEETLRASAVLHVGRRLDVLLGLRAGYAHFRLTLPAVLWVGSATLAAVPEVRYLLTSSWELRVAPITATGYWNKIWGFILEPGVGMAYRF
jgi:hypothetical protein